MKRYGNLYKEIFSMDNLRKAHQNARKGKGWYEEVRAVDADLEGHLKRLQNMLINHEYHTSEYERFIKKENGKEREIDFVGYRVFMGYVLLRKSTCKSFKKKMVAIRQKTENGQMMNHSEWCAVNSYKGWLKHCDSYRLQQKYIAPIQPAVDRYYLEVIKPTKKSYGKAA